jgi:predicted phosphoribosyltransferase
MRFADRADAGRALAAAVASRGFADPVVLGLPRGGVPVAAEVARALGAPLDVLGVRKLGAPGRPELAIGAIGEDGARVLDDDLVAALQVPPPAIASLTEREEAELARQLARFRGARARRSVRGRIAIVVDDGLATGSTASAAVQVVRARDARAVVVAVPVASTEATTRVGAIADEVIVLTTPPRFVAVGEWYDDFSPTSDAEVLACLATTSG